MNTPTTSTHANVTLTPAGADDYVSRHFHRVAITVPVPGGSDEYPLHVSANVRDWNDARQLANDCYRLRDDYAAQARAIVDHLTAVTAASLAAKGWDDGGEYARHMAANDAFGLCSDGCCGGPEEAIMSTRDDDPTVIRARFYRDFSRRAVA